MLHSGDGRIVIEGSAFSSQDEFSVTYREIAVRGCAFRND